MLLSEDHRAVQDAVRGYVQDRIAPHAAAWDRDAHFPKAELQGLAALGCYGVAVPAEHDGAGLDYLALAIILEEIAAGDGATSTIVSVNNCPVCSILMAWATTKQKEQWLKPLARGDMLGAFCLTEPHVGSQADGLKTTAVREGDEYVINGVKQFITSGKNGDVAIVMAVTDKAAGKRGISAFVVTPGLPGFKVGKKEDKMGLRASPTVQLELADLRVPADNLLGREGAGFTMAMQSLDNGRLGIAAQAIGIARCALEHATLYAGERRQFGKPIKEFEAIQFKLADMATRIAAARALLYQAAAAKDRGEQITQYSSMSKLFASETAMWVTTQAIQIFGGYGYVKEYPVERLFRDAKVTEIYEGTSEIQRVVIARHLLRGLLD